MDGMRFFPDRRHLGALLVLVAAGLPGILPAEEAFESNASEVVLTRVIAAVSEKASLVVSGKVLEAKARRVDAGRKIVTLVRLRVEHRFLPESPAAPAASDEIEVVLPGGVIGELGQIVGGVSLVQAGDGLLLFLRARPGLTSPRRWELTRLGPSLWRVEGETALLSPEALRLETRPGEPVSTPLSLPLARLPRLLAPGARP